MARTFDFVKDLAMTGKLTEHWGSRPTITRETLRRRRKAERQNRKAGR